MTLRVLAVAGGLWVLAAPPAAGQSPERVEGVALDASERTPVAGAWVRLLGTPFAAVTERDGTFRLRGVAAGRYTLRAERLGYAGREEPVEVVIGEVARVELLLTVAPVETGALVASVSKRAQTAGDVPLAVTVVEAEEVERRTPLTVQEVVAYAPGAQFVGDHINLRGSSGYSRRTGARVLFLIEGVPANAADAGNINWDIVPVAEVERVEVVKGPGSALYGSSALGGVVNVILREPAPEPRTRVRLLGGFYDSPPHREWQWSSRTLGYGAVEVTHGRRLGPVTGWLRYGRSRSDGYRENGFFSRTNVAGRFDIGAGARDTLRVFAGFARDRYGLALAWCVRGECADPQALAYQPLRVDSTALSDYAVSEKWFGSVGWRRSLGSAVTSRFRGSYLRNDWTSYFRDSTEGAESDRPGAEWQLDVRHGAWGVTTLGTEWAHTRVRSGLFGDHRVADGAVYVQEEWAPARWLRVSGGMRADLRRVDGEADETRWSPRAGLVVRSDERTRWRAAWGHGYRAPSVAELFTATRVRGFRVVPNPELAAERSRAVEVGVDRLVVDWLGLTASAFDVRYTDLIEADTVLGSEGEILIQFGNVPRGRVRGIEGALRWTRGTLVSGSIAYTYLDTRDLTADRPLSYRPRHLATASVTFHPGGLEVGLDHRYASRMQRVQVYPEDERVEMRVLDLRVGYRAGRYAILFSAENLANRAYTTIERNLEPLRHYRLTLQGEF